MKKIHIIFLLFVLSTGCKKFIDVNKDPNNPEDVQESLILAPAELAISQLQNGGRGVYVIAMYLQNAALAQEAPNVDTYKSTNAEMDGAWRDVYVTILKNLNTLTAKTVKNVKPNYVAVSKILTAFTLGNATDTWGDIPYTTAFNGLDNLKPAYDKQEDIYNAMQQLLDEAIVEIDKNDVIVPGTDDYYYGGNMQAWKKFAYTLKARFYMHLTKAPGHTASTQAGLVLAALHNGMQSNEDDFKMYYPGVAGQEGPWFLNFQPGETLVLASTFVDNLQNRNDPRLSAMVKPAESSGLYRGRIIGSTIEEPENFSYPSNFYAGIGATNYLLTYSEALFLKAEALLIKDGYTSAQPVYTDAIKSHMEKLGIADADIIAYVASRGTLTSGSALRLIMEEKAVSNFLNFETFNDWRRTGFPALTIVDNAVTDVIPRRLLYPQSEKINNPQPEQSAKLTDKVWWDN